MGKLSDMFKSLSTKDDSHGHQVTQTVPPPPYRDHDSTGHTDTDLKKDPSQLHSEKPSTSQIAKPPTPDPVPAVPDVLITLEVGPEAKQYKFSKARLCAESQVLRNHFRPDQPTANMTVLEYADYKPRSFDVITHWFQTGQLPEHWYEGHDAENAGVIADITALCKPLAFMQIRGMANDVIDATRKLFKDRNWTPYLSHLTAVRNAEMEHTYLFEFFIDTAVFNLMKVPKFCLVDNTTMAAEYRGLCDDPALTNIIMKKVLKWQLGNWGDPRQPAGCYYHDHTEGCKRLAKK